MKWGQKLPLLLRWEEAELIRRIRKQRLDPRKLVNNLAYYRYYDRRYDKNPSRDDIINELAALPAETCPLQPKSG